MRGGDNDCYRNDSVTAADETFAQIERELQRQPLRWPGKNFSQGNQPNCGGAPIHHKPMRKIHPHVLVLLSALALPSVSCRNPNEVSYETSTSAAATGSGGSQVKAKPSAFGPETTPAR